jgi:hypothetical protein
MTDFGGTLSGGLAGTNYESMYTKAQQEAVDQNRGTDPNKEAQDILGTKYTSSGGGYQRTSQDLYARAGDYS